MQKVLNQGNTADLAGVLEMVYRVCDIYRKGYND